MPITDPTDLPGTPLLWYDATISGSVLNTAGAVDNWIDQIAGDDPVSTGASRPSTGVETINGLNAISFSGAQWLRSFLNRPESWVATSAAKVHTFIVARVDATDGVLISNCSSDPDKSYAMYGSNSSGFPAFVQLDNSGTEVFNLEWDRAVAADPRAHIFHFTDVATAGTDTITLSLDGGEAVTTNYTDQNLGASANRFVIGARFRGSGPTIDENFDGAIGEIFSFSEVGGAWTEADVQDALVYLSEKWAIPLPEVPLFSPTDFNDLFCWYDANDVTTFTPETGNTTEWRDKSGNARHLDQRISTPNRLEDIVRRNRPAVFFNPGEILYRAQSEALCAGPSTIFVVAGTTAAGATNEQIISESLSSSASLYSVPIETIAGTQGWRWRMRGDGATTTPDQDDTDTGLDLVREYYVPKVMTVSDSTTSVERRVNGVSTGAAYSRSNVFPDTDRFALGGVIGTSNTTGDEATALMEVIAYSRVLSAAEIAEVEYYLTKKWLGVPYTVAPVECHYDMSDQNSAVAIGGVGALIQVVDISGHGHLLTQGTSGNRPTTATFTQHGLAVADFDGTNDRMTGTGFMTALASGFTAFCVAKPDTTGIRTLFGEGANADADPELTLKVTAGDLAQIKVDDNANTNRYTVDSSDIVDGNYHLMTWTDSLTLATLSVDGGTAASSGAYTRGTVTGDAFNIGTYQLTQFFDGKIAEIIVYPSVLSAAQIAAVNTSLAQKWDIALVSSALVADVVTAHLEVFEPTIDVVNVPAPPVVTAGLEIPAPDIDTGDVVVSPPVVTSTLEILSPSIPAAVTAPVVTSDVTVGGPVDPTSIPNLRSWLDASDTATLTGSPNVTAWADKSGNGLGATSVTGTPVTGTATLNGLNGLRFTSDRMTWTTTPGAFTLFAVARRATSTSTVQRLLSSYDGSGGLTTNEYIVDWVGTSNGTYWRFFRGTDGEVRTAQTYTSLDMPLVVSTRTGTTGGVLRINGSIEGTDPTSYANGSNQFHIGCDVDNTEFWEGDIFEFVMYDRELTDAEMVAVERYLMTKWDIGLLHIPGIAARYDASVSASVTDAGGGAVSQWSDISGQDRHLTQATAGSRPTTGTITQAGKNGIDFDGTADHLFRTDAFMTLMPSGFTAFCVNRADTTGIRVMFGEASSTDNDPALRQFITAADLAHIGCDDNVNTARYSVDSADIVTGGAHITTWTDSLTAATLQVDNLSTATSGAYTRGTITNNRFAIGATVRAATTLFYDGGMFEVVVFSRVLDAGEIALVQSYLTTKWVAFIAPVVTSDVSIPAPTLLFDTVVAAPLVTAAVSIPAPTALSSDIFVSPPVVTAALTIGTPSVAQPAAAPVVTSDLIITAPTVEETILPVSFDGLTPIPGPAIVELVVPGGSDTIEVTPESSDFSSTPPGPQLVFNEIAALEAPEPPAPPDPSETPIDDPNPYHVGFAELPTGGVRMELRTAAGALIEDLVLATAMTWQDPFNDVGTGSCTVPLDDAVVPSIVPNTEVWCYVYDILAYCFEIETFPGLVTVAEGEESVCKAELTGPGRASLMSRALVDPVKGIDDPLAPPHRTFSFASPDFRGVATWGNAVEGLRADVVDPNRYSTIEYVTELVFEEDTTDIIIVAAPIGWEVPYAHWIWGTADTTIVGKCYFRKTFSLGARTTVRFACTGDNLYTLWLDGSPILGEQVNEAGWREHKPLDLTLPAGTYTLGAMVENIEWTYGVNPAGFLFAAYPIDGNGEPVLDGDGEVVSFCVSDGTWKAMPYPAVTPGWTPGEIILELIAEAQARGALAGLVADFTSLTDSHGNPWDGSEGGGSHVPSFSMPIGANVLDALNALVDGGWVDWRMQPGGRVLQMFNQTSTGMGTAAAYAVTGTAMSQDVFAQEFVAQERPTNVLQVKHANGYFRITDAASFALYGAFEDQVSIDTTDRAEAEREARVIFNNHAIPRRSMVVGIDPIVDGDKPYVSYGTGDQVVAPNEVGTPSSYRVLSISVGHDELARPKLALELDSRLNARFRRRINLLETLGRGVVGSTTIRNTLTGVNGVAR